MARKAKTIDPIITLPAGGFVALVTTYPDGRAIDEPRLLADGRFPFPTKALAARALERWTSGVLDGLRSITPDTLQPLRDPGKVWASNPRTAPRSPVLFRPETVALEPAAKRVSTLPPAKPSIVAHASLNGVVVTRCPEFVRRNHFAVRDGEAF
jgi:hypothetical protein